MAQPRKPKHSSKRHSSATGVPPERWSVEAPFDSAEYLEGEPPTYASSDDEEKEEAAP